MYDFILQFFTWAVQGFWSYLLALLILILVNDSITEFLKFVPNLVRSFTGKYPPNEKGPKEGNVVLQSTEDDLENEGNHF